MNAKVKARTGRAVVMSELDELVFEEAQRLKYAREAATGVGWQVDHKVPMRCAAGSGLHNAYNIAVVPKRYNQRKYNKWADETGFEWVLQC